MPKLSQHQVKAIFAQNKRRGLRTVINALKGAGYRPTEWRTFYHGTGTTFLKDIKKTGLKGFNGGGPYESLPYVGSRSTAEAFGNRRKGIYPDWKLATIKVKVPKRDVLVWRQTHLSVKDRRGRIRAKPFTEFAVRGPIKSKNFRSIKRYD